MARLLKAAPAKALARWAPALALGAGASLVSSAPEARAEALGLAEALLRTPHLDLDLAAGDGDPSGVDLAQGVAGLLRAELRDVPLKAHVDLPPDAPPGRREYDLAAAPGPEAAAARQRLGRGLAALDALLARSPGACRAVPVEWDVVLPLLNAPDGDDGVAEGAFRLVWRLAAEVAAHPDPAGAAGAQLWGFLEATEVVDAVLRGFLAAPGREGGPASRVVRDFAAYTALVLAAQPGFVQELEQRGHQAVLLALAQDAGAATSNVAVAAAAECALAVAEAFEPRRLELQADPALWKALIEQVGWGVRGTQFEALRATDGLVPSVVRD